MNNQIMLAQATPPGGIILRVRNQPGGLLGATIEGIDGPNVTLEFSANGVNGWTAFPPPVALSQETYLRLTRTDTSNTISTIRLTVPGGSGSLSATESNGYLFIEDLPGVPTGDRHVALDDRVAALEQGGGGGGGGGGSAPPAFRQGQNLSVATTGAVTVRQVQTMYVDWPAALGSAPTTVDQIIVVGAVFDASNVDGIYLSETNGATVVDLFGAASFASADGNTTITIPPTVMGVQSEQLTIDLTAPIDVRTYAGQNASLSRMRTRYSGGATGSSVSIILRAAAGMIAPGPIDPMSMPVVYAPSATDYNRRHGYTELVVPESGSPYLRTWNSPNGQWHRAAFTAEP